MHPTGPNFRLLGSFSDKTLFLDGLNITKKEILCQEVIGRNAEKDLLVPPNPAGPDAL